MIGQRDKKGYLNLLTDPHPSVLYLSRLETYWGGQHEGCSDASVRILHQSFAYFKSKYYLSKDGKKVIIYFRKSGYMENN